MTDDRIGALIGATIAWRDTEAAFGEAHPRTRAAQDRLRQQIAAIEPDRPPLTLIPGGME